MIMKIMVSVMFVSISILTGCASVPLVTKEQDTAVKSFSKPSDDKTGLYVYRNSVTGQALKKAIYLDGSLVGETANKTFFYKLIKPGKHHLTTESEFGNNDLSFQADGGKNYFVEQLIVFFVGGAKLEMVSEKEGMAEVLKCDMADEVKAQDSNVPHSIVIENNQEPKTGSNSMNGHHQGTRVQTSIPIGVPFLVNSLESSELISSGRIHDYEKTKITILEVTKEGIVTAKGSFGVHKGGMTGFITPADSNMTIKFDINKDKWFMCVGEIILVPNLKLKLSDNEILLAGPNGARIKKPSTGKEIILIEGAANLIQYTADN
jgi:hypothetical protein